MWKTWLEKTLGESRIWEVKVEVSEEDCIWVGTQLQCLVSKPVPQKGVQGKSLCHYQRVHVERSKLVPRGRP